jgi:hypothetical protein
MQQWYLCPRCNAQVSFGMIFCGNCGMQLSWPTQQQIQPPSVHQQQQPWPRIPPMPPEQKRAEGIEALGEKDHNILKDALERGTPCIPFIPVNAIQQSLSVMKPEGHKGFFIARIPALFKDGITRYLYKEEFMLWLSIQGALGKMKSQGRTYFFIGLHQDMEKPPGNRLYLDPRIFYQNNLSLHDVEFQEKIEFFRPAHSPLLELTFIPADHNLRVGYLGVVNFLLAARLHPIGEKEDPSGIFQSYEEWRSAQYPTSGAELENLLRQHVQHLKSGL